MGTLIVGPPKTDAGRRIFVLPAPLIPEIEAHLAAYGPFDAGGLVFTGSKGGPLRDHVWQAKWAKARSALDIDELHFHDLRHVANTLTEVSDVATEASFDMVCDRCPIREKGFSPIAAAG